jgi:hypothetical protein
MKETLNARIPVTGKPTDEVMIPVDGKGQVLDMLRAADPEFREFILRGIEKRDARLARELRRDL